MSNGDKREDLREILKNFLYELNDQIEIHKFEEILGNKSVLSSSDLGQKPEPFTEDNLIYPILDVLGLDKKREPYGKGRDWPDFELINIEPKTIGENKPINKFEEAVQDIEDYLDKKSIGAEYGIATDGVNWSVFKIETGGDTLEYPIACEFDLRDVLVQIAKEENLFSPVSDVNVEENLEEFIDLFSRDELSDILSSSAPRRIRDERKKDIDDFYDLYIELLFGKGKEHDYESCLKDDIIAPKDASGSDEDLFAITLVNRLLFIKFLEDRGVLEDGFLKKRVDFYEKHQEELTGRLYSSQIKPLFYDLLNTPSEKRDSKYKKGWFSDVPYLNGGLFKENIDHEREYQVLDRLLPKVIDDLIEGHELDLKGKQIDPALLGSVFEKTINHIEQERTQKDIGAYYTPNDVTSLIIDQTVDEKVRDVIIETFAENIPDEEKKDAFLTKTQEKSLEDILKNIENQEGWFGSPDSIKECIDELTELNILDPACGSGHFLTAAMDEIFRSQLSLLRGLKGDEEEISNKEKYDLKKVLALNSIYGVDVDRVAAEIAKLRVWLKIVEGNGWQEEFGKLPNIEVNISAGNSLIGFPYKGSQRSFDAWGPRVEELKKLRKKYKFEEEIDRDEVLKLQNKIRKEMDEEYLSQLNYKTLLEMEEETELKGIIDSIHHDDHLKDWFGTVQVKRKDGNALEDSTIEDLDEFGFTTHKKSARMNIAEKDKDLRSKNKSNREVRLTIMDKLSGLLADNFYFKEFEHRPTEYDLNNILGRPFHWITEFPEVSSTNGPTHKMEFDVILGNPPYGNLLDEYECKFIKTYKTSDYNEIAANFVEREIQLLKEDGYLGKVTTAGLFYDSSMFGFHDLLKNNLDNMKISCFERRPSQIFKNAQVQVAIISGIKIRTKENIEIKTSKFIRFNEESRNEELSNIKYSEIDKLILGNKIGEENDSYYVIPKLGPKMSKKILKSLKNASSRTIKEATGKEGSTIYRQRGGGYRPIAILEKIYESSSLSAINFENEIERDYAFLVVNSMWFYFYWMAYGDARHVNTGQIKRFPLPEKDILNKNKEKIQKLKEELWNSMQSVFDQERNYFYMSYIKNVIHDVDSLLGELLNVKEEKLEYIKDYDSKYIWTKEREDKDITKEL